MGRDESSQAHPHRRLTQQKMIIVDVECTGLDPQIHSLVSIGALDFLNPTNQFYQECKPFPNAVINPQAIEYAGFSQESLNSPDKQSLNDLMKNFMEWTKSCEFKTFGGQNPSFDVSFLKISVKRCNLDWPLHYRGVDLSSICYCHYLNRHQIPPVEKFKMLSLDQVLEYVGIGPEPKPHHALNGAQLSAEAFSRLIYGKNLIEKYKEFKIPQYLII